MVQDDGDNTCESIYVIHVNPGQGAALIDVLDKHSELAPVMTTKIN